MTHFDQVDIGFMPLLDAAILIIAQEKGFASGEGLALNLVRETSWANIRDRISVGHFDAAHMLAPMPIASNLGLNPLNANMIAPMALGLGGNAITVSTDLWARMKAQGAPDDLSVRETGEALRMVIAQDKSRRLTFGVVHPHSGHNYELRYWLAACGIAPDVDVDFVIVPPPLMPDALAAQTLDGFCVGEPWNSIAVANGHGAIVTVKAKIWGSSPEKVLGMKSEWAAQSGDVVHRLLRGLYAASEWCGHPQNAAEIADILGRPAYLDRPAELILRGLSGKIVAGSGAEVTVPDFFLPHARNATFPWVSHAAWFYSQMVRWGHVAHTQENAIRAKNSFRPDIYREALGAGAVHAPAVDSKIEGNDSASEKGAESGFFDGAVFDPDTLDRYIDAQSVVQTA